MATEPTYEFPLPQNGYAAFDAISMRNLILDRLNAQNIYTDQNYIGSNLAAIIDVISYSFNTLLYYLNRTSSEATFTEAQIYENIARLTKILDYKPVGYQTSTLTFSCSSSSLLAGSYTIPKYSSITANGVSFSFNEDISFTISDGTVTTALTELSNKKLLYQGTYKESTVVTATGEPNEIIVLDNSVGYIDHFNIDVYVHEAQTKNWYQYKNVPNLYTERPESRVFEKTFNSNSIYEIKFGNGISGRQLQAGDKVIIYYLQSSGPAGIVGPNTLANKSGSNVAYSATLQEIRNNTNLFGLKYLTGADLNTLEFDNFVGSTYPRAGETADSIRANAPGVFKSQYRLVTKNDYLAYIRTNFSQFISDVRVFSNWEYVADYLKYFKSINANAFGFNQVMFNQVAYADACNFNNIYVCAIPRISAGASAKYLLSSQKISLKLI